LEADIENAELPRDEVVARKIIDIEGTVKVFECAHLLCGEGGSVDQGETGQTGVEQGEDGGVVGWVGGRRTGEGLGRGDGGGAELSPGEEFGDRSVWRGLFGQVVAEGSGDIEPCEGMVDLGAEEVRKVLGRRWGPARCGRLSSRAGEEWGWSRPGTRAAWSKRRHELRLLRRQW